MRFELTTPTLARLCSTPELRPRPLCAFANVNARELLRNSTINAIGSLQVFGKEIEIVRGN